MKSIEAKIKNRITKIKTGSVVTPAHFLDIGSRQAVDIALHRLVKNNQLRRIARGLYDSPREDPDLGLLAPSVDEIVKAVQERDNTVIQASGGYAANQLGLSDQVPMKLVFYTNGPERRMTIGKRTIFFKHTTPRNMATANRKSGQVIQALRYLGKSNIDEIVITKLQQQLSCSDKQQLLQDLRYAPAWIGAIIRRIVKDEE